ncbi:MAG TPA: hypothetical protein VLL05_12220 [Terriglobales bacterium]|nr:hypothetical protein [Terriglobales bacterium]
MKDPDDEWQALCAQASAEQDPDKLLELTRRIVQALDAKNKRLNRQPQIENAGHFPGM